METEEEENSPPQVGLGLPDTEPQPEPESRPETRDELCDPQSNETHAAQAEPTDVVPNRSDGQDLIAGEDESESQPPPSSLHQLPVAGEESLVMVSEGDRGGDLTAGEESSGGFVNCDAACEGKEEDVNGGSEVKEMGAEMAPECVGHVVIEEGGKEEREGVEGEEGGDLDEGEENSGDSENREDAGIEGKEMPTETLVVADAVTEKTENEKVDMADAEEVMENVETTYLMGETVKPVGACDTDVKEGMDSTEEANLADGADMPREAEMAAVSEEADRVEEEGKAEEVQVEKVVTGDAKEEDEKVDELKLDYSGVAEEIEVAQQAERTNVLEETEAAEQTEETNEMEIAETANEEDEKVEELQELKVENVGMGKDNEVPEQTETTNIVEEAGATEQMEEVNDMEIIDKANEKDKEEDADFADGKDDIEVPEEVEKSNEVEEMEMAEETDRAEEDAEEEADRANVEEADIAEEEVEETSKSASGKRKRGKNAKAPVRASTRKKMEEDVCFICFDGGELVLCDRR